MSEMHVDIITKQRHLVGKKRHTLSESVVNDFGRYIDFCLLLKL